jgi:hypothetical protein
MKRPAFLGSKKQTGTPVSMAETVTITGYAGKSTTTTCVRL